MSELSTKCAIWPSYITTEHTFIGQDVFTRYVTSERAGGTYQIARHIDHYPEVLDDPARARLTTWLVDQRTQGDHYPNVTKEIIDNIKYKQPLPVNERADRLLKYLTRMTGTAGKEINLSPSGDPLRAISGSVPTNSVFLCAMAWSESLWSEPAYTSEDFQYLIEYLDEEGWIRKRSDWSCYVTVKGHQKVADLHINVDTSQAFVAMWLHESMDEAFKTGIKPGIKDAGYEPLRIDQKEHVNKIEDEIIAELRRSRFVVADFTQGASGPRGGVYYEAGFAHGRGINVIFTCHEDAVESLHFDTSHYNHIIWTNPTDLREQLKNRILAVIGEGPGLNTIP